MREGRGCPTQLVYTASDAVYTDTPLTARVINTFLKRAVRRSGARCLCKDAAAVACVFPVSSVGGSAVVSVHSKTANGPTTDV